MDVVAQEAHAGRPRRPGDRLWRGCEVEDACPSFLTFVQMVKERGVGGTVREGTLVLVEAGGTQQDGLSVRLAIGKVWGTPLVAELTKVTMGKRDACSLSLSCAKSVSTRSVGLGSLSRMHMSAELAVDSDGAWDIPCEVRGSGCCDNLDGGGRVMDITLSVL